MNNRISVATIDSPQFINLQQSDISPLMSKCEIKVLYVGQNRNKSAITKQVATEMSRTLRGCPIVGYFIENKEDFGDHGDQMIIDGEGVKFKKLTKPYGFIAPDAKVWFQFFEDRDEFGNICMREYLMTEGYLWTSQYEECKRVLKNNNPQSMELDEKTLKGHWSTDSNSGVDFFIINDATFSKLCILGDDVEPCFEGARVSAPDISSTFSKDNDFLKDLFNMMSELKYALNNTEGGLSMDSLETPIVEEQAVEAQEPELDAVVEVEESEEDFSTEQDETSESDTVEIEDTVEEFAKKDDEEEKKDEEKSDSDSEASDSKDSEEGCDEEDDKKKKYELLETEFAALQEKYSALEQENKNLLAFKADIENKQKDELISSFYMLSDEDKAEVIENKANYSLDDIEAKLSVICVRKKVNFSDVPENEEVATVFNLNAIPQDNSPEWVRAVKANMNK